MGHLIGLSGRAGAGKDTVCGFIQEWGDQRGLSVKREAFADRLKLSAARLFFPDIGLDDAIAWCNQMKEDGTLTAIVDNDVDRRAWALTGRELLQRYGTEAHREVFGIDFWVEQALSDLSADFTVVTDPRFQNEADAIHAKGGELWRVVRPGDAIAGTAHASEQPLPDSDIDMTIVNDGTLDGLREGVFLTMDGYLNLSVQAA